MKNFGVILVILLIVIVVVFVACRSSWGLGGGTGQEDAKDVMATVSDETSLTTMAINYVEVTVHENSYIFNNEVYEFDDVEVLLDALKQESDECTVNVTDDNASSKAYSQLLAMFDENKIKYIEVSE